MMLNPSEHRVFAPWEKVRVSMVTIMAAILVADLVTLRGLLLLCMVAPLTAAATWGQQLLPHSSARRSRIAKCRRHIEAMETELGWRERPEVTRPTPIPSYARMPAGTSVITATTAALQGAPLPVVSGAWRYRCSHCGAPGSRSSQASPSNMQFRHCHICGCTDLFGKLA